MKLEKNKQPSFRLIYNIKPIELKMLKIYIKIHLANNFIGLLSPPLEHLFSLFKNQIEVSNFVWIINVSITLLLKIYISYLWLVNCLISSAGP